MRIEIQEEQTKNLITVVDGKPEFLNGGIFIRGNLEGGTTNIWAYEEFLTNVSIVDVKPGVTLELRAIKSAASGTGEAPKQVRIIVS